uniref:Endo/exonuclease/phosphatase domain-containing protein n=1 Tax=Trichobilharzia regenti TaxID=157069 RepID=A0AA85JDZ1_TRIRE|nr:unnamed protein product [Trichobilharzia regenti]
MKDEFYYQLSDLLKQAGRRDIVVLAGDLNAQVGRLSSEENRLGGQWGLHGRRSDNGDRLLQLCADHNLFLASTNFRHSHRRSATWRPPSAKQAWTQIDHIAVSFRWRGCIQDCRSFWSTCLDSDHALVCAKFVLRFGGVRKSRRLSVDVSKLVAPATSLKYQNELKTMLASNPPSSIDEHWLHVQGAMQKASVAACGLKECSANASLFVCSLLFAFLRYISGNSKGPQATRCTVEPKAYSCSLGFCDFIFRSLLISTISTQPDSVP